MKIFNKDRIGKYFNYNGIIYKVGDLVLLKKSILSTNYAGKIVQISDFCIQPNTGFELHYDDYKCFETKDGMILPLNRIEKKVSGTFFKKLPNNFTGTIDVVNGYIGKPEILDEEEKRYLEGVIRPFKDKVERIIKNSEDRTRAFIEIRLKSEYICLPYFKANTMYKGMELDEIYTLEELGLFEEK